MLVGDVISWLEMVGDVFTLIHNYRDADSNDSKDDLQQDPTYHWEKLSLDSQVFQNSLEFVSHSPAFGIG